MCLFHLVSISCNIPHRSMIPYNTKYVFNMSEIQTFRYKLLMRPKQEIENYNLI